MNAVEQAQRARIVAIAKTWEGTAYHHAGMVKGVGVDCATLLVATFQEAGLVDVGALPSYSAQWHIHHDEEKYANFIRMFATEATGKRAPLPGDVVVWKFHRSFAHGAIVVAWPTVIHAMTHIGCVMDDAEKNQMLSRVSERVPTRGQPRPMRLFSYWAV